MSEKNESLKSLVTISLIILAILFIGITCIYFTFNNWSERGQFGDAFGSMNALFSGLAFAGIIYTILLQRKELQLQREELTQTREELKRSADAQEKSEAALQAQTASLRTAAKLNALSTLASYYVEQVRNYPHTLGLPNDMYSEYFKKEQKHIKDIEIILATLQDSTNEK